MNKKTGIVLAALVLVAAFIFFRRPSPPADEELKDEVEEPAEPATKQEGAAKGSEAAGGPPATPKVPAQGAAVLPEHDPFEDDVAEFKRQYPGVDFRKFAPLGKRFLTTEISVQDYQKMRGEGNSLNSKAAAVVDSAAPTMELIRGRRGEIEVPFVQLKLDCPTNLDINQALVLYVNEGGEILEAQSLDDKPQEIPGEIYSCKFEPFFVEHNPVPFITRYLPVFK